MNMRAFTLTLSLFSSMATAFGQEQAKPVDQDIFDNLLKSEDGQKIYEACKNYGNGSAKDFRTCLDTQWTNLVSSDSGAAQRLAEQLGTVEVTFDKEGNQIRKPTGSKIDNLNVNTLSETFNGEVDPSILALRTYLREQLSKALYGELKEDKISQIKLVDHSTFYTLFESQVGQNIIVAVSDYCMGTNLHKYKETLDLLEQNPSSDPNNPNGFEKAARLLFFYPDSATDLAENKRLNLDKIKSNFSDSGSRDSSKDAFTKCVASISTICHKQANYRGTSPNPVPSGAKEQACLVTDFLVQARQSLLKVSEIKKQIDENAKTSGRGIAFEELSQNKFYKDGQAEGEKSIRELAVQTSTDIKNAGMQDAADKAREKLDECASGDETACKGFVSDDLEAKKEQLANEFLKAKAQEERLKIKLAEDPENAMNYLKEEGHSEEEATKIIDSLGEQDTIKAIEDRYKAQKDAVIKNLAEKIDKKSAADVSGFAATAGDIKTELALKTETLIKVMHFSNLASTYLEVSVIGSTSGQKSVNTVAAFSELSGDSMATGSKRAPSNDEDNPLYAGQEDLIDKNLQALEELKNSGGNEEGSGATFGVDVINNEILKY